MNSAKSTSHLTGGRLLAGNTMWNLLGQLLPMMVAVVTVPFLVRDIGAARFGVLSIAWVIIGYFSLFDLGIGRALTKLVAEKVGSEEEETIPSLAWMSLFLLLILGLFGGGVTCVVSRWLVGTVLKVPAGLQAETLSSFYLLALSIPVVTVTSGFRGILEALQRFRVLNLIRIPMSVYSFAGPLLVLPFSHSLVPVISVLVAGRLIGLLAHVFACFHAMSAIRHRFSLEPSLVPPLLRMGGWMTVSNLIGPAILYVDRFLIGAVLSLSAVTYYTAPFDMVSRLLVVPGAISGVLFPAFAQTNARDQERTGLLLARGLKYILLILFPITLVVVTLAPEILGVWLGPAFAESSGSVLRWLAVGILVNSLAAIPFGLLQAIGRADIDGKVLLIELPIYAAAAWVLTTRFGLEGAAIAWVGRATLEMLVFLALGWHCLPRKVSLMKPFTLSAIVVAPILYIGTLWSGLALKAAFLLCALVAFGVAAWVFALKPEERMFLARRPSGAAAALPGMGISAGGKSDAV